jgi:pyridoxal 5'-phosphate synthase pdxS subunit
MDSENITSLPSRLFISGSEVQTPVGTDGLPRPPVNGITTTAGSSSVGTFAVKTGLAQMLKICHPCEEALILRRCDYGCGQVCGPLRGGLTCSAEQARIAEEAGACAVMALERVPADIRQQGGVARMSDPKMIKEIMDAVSIPVMAKVRIGHFVEAQVPPHIQKMVLRIDPRGHWNRLHRRK